MSDLFAKQKEITPIGDYTAKHIEVLEGLEPVRHRPGMYIGGTGKRAMQHLVQEILDNSMDEAVAGFATRIEFTLHADDTITIKDNGRGIPIDPHPKFPDKSALEVILTTLHAGGKFNNKVYHTSGGLHGVGISVVNALSDKMTVEIIRDKTLYKQEYSRGVPTTKLEEMGAITNRKGTSISFHPDPEIFGEDIRYSPRKLYSLVRSKAYLFKGVEIRWNCDPALITETNKVPENEVIHFPNGIKDFLHDQLKDINTINKIPFAGEVPLAEAGGKVEWAISWTNAIDNFVRSFCNTIPTIDGGTHETGIRAALLKGLRAYGDMVGNKKVSQMTADDVLESACVVLSLFIGEPQFQGQTKEKLGNPNVAKLVENAVRDHFDHFLTSDPDSANKLLENILERTDERLKRKKQKETKRKAATQKLRLPGKLTDCSRNIKDGTEIFIVEGDSAGGSAKMARNRETQAILPLRGKILNVASATRDKIRANNEISDMLLALGCETKSLYREEDLRYEKIVIMTDADVDGAHIAALLMTFFYKELPDLVKNGHLYLACPPLYRITQGGKTHYAQDEAEREALEKELGKKKTKVDVGRFKGLGEMTAPQLKETTMNPVHRTLLQVTIDDNDEVSLQVENLMGKKPELRFNFIQEQMQLHGDELQDILDV